VGAHEDDASKICDACGASYDIHEVVSPQCTGGDEVTEEPQAVVVVEEPQVIQNTGAAQKALDIMTKGSLSALTIPERADFLANMALSLGLNPLTKPVDLIKNDKGELIVYYNRGATDQLRAKHKVNLQVVEKYHPTASTYAVLVRATLPNGRQDESTGVVVLTQGMDPIGQANAIMKAECVPVSYEILTQEGFKSPFEVVPGELVAAMDPTTRESQWVPLEGITFYENQAVVERANAYITFRTTAGHSWVTDVGLRALESFDNGYIHLAGELPGATFSCLTPQEAALLGWIITDGHFRLYKGRLYSAYICQSKQANFEHITWACAGLDGTVTKGLTNNRERGWLDQHFWYLNTRQTQRLLVKAGIVEFEDIALVPLQLDKPARAAMLEAMVRADSDKRGMFCKTKPYVMQTFRLLSTLQGILLSRESVLPAETRALATKPLYCQRQLSWTKVARQNLEVIETTTETVWCPTTQLGTWYCKTDEGQVLVTGNTKAKRRATLSILGLSMLDESEMDTIPLFQQQLNQPRSLPAPTASQAPAAPQPSGGVGGHPEPVVRGNVATVGSQDVERASSEKAQPTPSTNPNTATPGSAFPALTPKAHTMPRRLPVAPPVTIK
jgi:hypothetical protein